MSSVETKTVLRAEFPALKGKSKTEAFPIYKLLLGKPDELDLSPDKTEVYHFGYDGEFQPSHDFRTGKWGIDWVLYHDSGYRTYIDSLKNGVSMKDLKHMIHIMHKQFGVDKDSIRMIHYEWYHGGDEPVSFDDEIYK